jgi:hypothetical protein
MTLPFGGPMQFTPDETVEEVLALVEARFGRQFRHPAPVLVRHRPGQANGARWRISSTVPAEIRRLPGRDAGR